ncbi:hypothetical protein ACFVHR_04570 [Streptomyces sp. NPDC127168]|uniref:hypothetical protein n=1 Tax=unclassified Streptomyces TaxID=2593676 RepID=UPI003633A2AD
MSTEIVKHESATPATLDGAVRFAQLLADADLLPRQFVGRPANVLYAVEYGRTLGITPVAAITGIHVIEGKPSASSGLIGALVRKAGHKLRVRSDGKSTATAQIVRADDPDFTYECTWDLERAAQAGLCEIKNGKPWARDRNGKPTAWEKYTAAMLKARAITEVARDACEDVLFGLHYTPEELGANVNQDGEPVEAEVQQLRRVQPGEGDPWAAPAPSQGTPPEQEFADDASQETDRAKVQEIYRQANSAGLLAATVKVDGESLELGKFLIARGQQLAEPSPTREQPNAGNEQSDVTDAEVVAEGETEADAAEKALRAAAATAGLDNLDEEFERSYGLPISEAGAPQMRQMTALLTGNAA